MTEPTPTTFVAKFAPGRRVTIADDPLPATVERVIFGRNMTAPVYMVEWWHAGQLCQRELHEDDLS